MASPPSKTRLRRDLGLIDVFAISTGAMFSSGFFLLPGIAFDHAGAWMVMAYGLSALLVVPAMLSKAELASALPRAGGTYYYLDRSMGPLVGTIGGLGTWIAMGLKNTFALIGIGAYLGLFLDVDMNVLAVALAVGFTLLNLVGTKETARLQRWMVYALVGILTAFVAFGLAAVAETGLIATSAERLAAAPATDIDGVLGTVGLVFVSYAGLTKVSGVAEEVERPDRNILLGMVMSLAVAAGIYVAGTWVLVMVVPHDTLASDLTPIATAASTVFDFLPGRVGVGLVVVAAVAAFGSTANAGIMAASRYLLAMGRDRLISTSFAQVGRFGTPTLAVVVTGGVVVGLLLTLDVVSIAKLASAFQLLMFALVNLAVIVMRESQLETYHPTVRTPLYPWTQLAGIFLSLALIIEMGRMAQLFTLGLVGVGVGWYFVYARERVVRRGAILHWFERLGRDRFDALEEELWTILKETGLRPDDPYDELVEQAPLLDLDGQHTFDEVAALVATPLAESAARSPAELREAFSRAVHSGLVPVSHGFAVPHVQLDACRKHALWMVRARGGVTIAPSDGSPEGTPPDTVQGLFFLVGPTVDPGQHLRLLATLATRIEQHEFLDCWLNHPGAGEVRQSLTDDQLTRFARRLTRELRRGGGWRPHSPPGRFEHILAVDLTGALDAEVVTLSADLAVSNGATLTLAEALEFVPSRALTPAEVDAIERSAHAERLARVASELEDRGLDARSFVLPGRPWLEVVRAVMRDHHDLVIVDANGARQGLDHAIHHLMRKCPCPVWVVRPTPRAPVRRVLAAIDATAADADHRSLNTQILALAALAMEQLEAELHLVHAWRVADAVLVQGEDTVGRDEPPADWRDRYRLLLDDIVGGHPIDRSRTHIHLVEGEPPTVITQTAGRLGVELIIMGTVCRTGVAGFLIGNTAERVLESASCSVLAVKPPGFVTPVATEDP